MALREEEGGPESDALISGMDISSSDPKFFSPVYKISDKNEAHNACALLMLTRAAHIESPNKMFSTLLRDIGNLKIYGPPSLGLN